MSDVFLIMLPSELKQEKNCHTSNEVWITLQNIHESKGSARKATLLNNLILQKIKESDNDDLNKFMETVNKLNQIDEIN